jgi:hypothetical protein
MSRTGQISSMPAPVQAAVTGSSQLTGYSWAASCSAVSQLVTCIEALITTHATDLSTERLVLEGSALWPESVATLDVASVTAVWLTASDTFFRTRIYNESKFAEATARGQAMIEKFLARTQLYNERMMTAVTHLNLPYLNVEQSPSIEELGSVDISRGSAKRVHQTKC